MSHFPTQSFNGVSAPVPDPDKLYPMSFRVTAREKSKIKSLAGGGSVSAYLRKTALKGDVSKRKSDISIKVDMAARILGMLGQAGVYDSLARIADAAESGALPVTDELIDELRNACAMVLAMRHDLIEALGVKIRD